MRLYYTCPIQALYMMKEYGIKFECKHNPEEMLEYCVDEELYPFEHSDIEQPDMMGELIGIFKNFRKIYVKKEYEKIFEPKDWDLKNDNTQAIIMRNNKHFFYPEQEHEQEIEIDNDSDNFIL